VEDRRPTTTQEIIEMFKALVRPYLICSAWTAWLIMIVCGEEIPPILAGVAGAITVEYGIERAIKRLRGR